MAAEVLEGMKRSGTGVVLILTSRRHMIVMIGSFVVCSE